jgi:acyl-CoA synthetase (AMP-forming)/AMP-acid ligase II
VLIAMFAGRRIVLLSQFDTERWLHPAETQRITHAFVVPTMLKRILDDPAFARTDLSSLEVLSYGAAPMPLPVIRRAIQMLPETVQFINAFGQTETTSTVMMLGPDDHVLRGSPEEVERKLRRLGSIGRPLDDVEVRILDDDGVPLGVGKIGEIAIQTARMMRGYYGQEDATSATVQDGWLRTRDLGWIDEDGYVFLAGRKSDLIIRGGENIAPDEIELVLGTHPAVDEVAVFGVPDEEWGERVAAAVVKRSGVNATEDGLIEHARARLASFKKPEIIVFVTELPRNALGKVLRKELRAQFGHPAAAPDASVAPAGTPAR